jgi:hypothetical protein
MVIEVWSDVVCSWCYIGKAPSRAGHAGASRGERPRLLQLVGSPTIAADAGLANKGWRGAAYARTGARDACADRASGSRGGHQLRLRRARQAHVRRTSLQMAPITAASRPSGGAFWRPTSVRGRDRRHAAETPLPRPASTTSRWRRCWPSYATECRADPRRRGWHQRRAVLRDRPPLWLWRPRSLPGGRQAWSALANQAECSSRSIDQPAAQHGTEPVGLVVARRRRSRPRSRPEERTT